MSRLFAKVTRDTLPQIKEKYPFLYLEHGRLEVDDSIVKWVDSLGNVVPLPIATISALLIGPGTTVTHEAIKTSAAANCTLCWVGEDSLHFYAAGFTPTADTRNFQRQMKLASSPTESLEVARRMFLRRFPQADLTDKPLASMMGMEGARVQKTYQQKAEQYGVGWKGRQFTPNNFELSDITNKALTSANSLLYSIICSAIHSLGYSPHIGFIHSGSPLPFVYDIADLYKEALTIDMAFALTKEMAGNYDKELLQSSFQERVLAMDLLRVIGLDINDLLGGSRARRSSK